MTKEKQSLCAAECLRAVLCRLVTDPSRLDEPLLECCHEYLFAPTECRFKTPDKEIRDGLAYLKAVVDMEGIKTASELRRYFDRLDRQTDVSIISIENSQLLEQLLADIRPRKRKLLPNLRTWKTTNPPAGLNNSRVSQYLKRCHWAIKSLGRARIIA
jgi:hypothetical protein